MPADVEVQETTARVQRDAHNADGAPLAAIVELNKAKNVVRDPPVTLLEMHQTQPIKDAIGR